MPKKIKNFETHPKYSNFLKVFLFCLATSYLILKSKITSFWWVFAILSAFFVKIVFFNAFKVFFNEFFEY
jgi:hypothetical protein